MNMVGTPCSAVQRSSATAASVAAGRTPRRETPSCSRRYACEHRQHHAEAVIERHRECTGESFSESRIAIGDVTRIVDDVVMRERCALRVAGRAAGELDVDGLAGAELRFQRASSVAVSSGLAASRHDIAEIEHAGRLRVAHADHGAQVGQLRGACSALGAASASSGASDCSISRYFDVLNCSAATSALQPTLFSAYSSSASR